MFNKVSFWFSLIVVYFCSKVLDVFIKAAEFMEIPVRQSDGEPLLKLFMLVRSELNLDLKNIRQEQAKFWKQHPAFVKVAHLQPCLSICLSLSCYSNTLKFGLMILAALHYLPFYFSGRIIDPSPVDS